MRSMETLSGQPLDGYSQQLDGTEPIEIYVSREARCCPLAVVLMFSGLIMASNGVLVPWALTAIIVGLALLMTGLGLPGTGTRDYSST